MKVKALQGDTVDLLCWRHYGTTQGMTEKVIAANPGLSGQLFLNLVRRWNSRSRGKRNNGRWYSYGAEYIPADTRPHHFFMSVVVTGIGVMTISEKIAMAGLLLGALSLARAWLHRGRIERAQKRRNDLIAQILSQSEAESARSGTPGA